MGGVQYGGISSTSQEYCPITNKKSIGVFQKYFHSINTFQDEEITYDENDDWKLLKDFAKSAIADKSEYDLCKR